jgi:hypothetical protein
VWNDGEIDFPEGDLTGTISAFLHYVGAPSQQDYSGTGAGYADWHTATTEWSPNRVAFYFDGRLIGTSTNHVRAKPMHYVLQTETELGSDPIPATATPATCKSIGSRSGATTHELPMSPAVEVIIAVRRTCRPGDAGAVRPTHINTNSAADPAYYSVAS